MSNEPVPGRPFLPEGFGRAAEKLADTVRHVVDIAVGPKLIITKAKAQAESALIAAKTDAEIQELQTRTIDRLRKREFRRQKNIESIAAQAVKALPPPEKISDKPVSEDWTSRFFEECQDINDKQMQQIWARILAGEVARPGSFSPKTLSVVRDLTKDDATLFAKLCRFTWIIGGVGPVPVILDDEDLIITEAGLDFARLTHLTSIGLVEFDGVAGYKLKGEETQVQVTYCGRTYQLKSDAKREFEFGHVIYTAVGLELINVARAVGHEEYRKMVLDKWSRRGWKEAAQEAAA